MTKVAIKRILGPPVMRDFYKNVDEWHYCKTGSRTDEFIALFFYKGKLIEKVNYLVTLSDVGVMRGSCKKFIKMGNYRVPFKVLEIRMKR